MKFRVKEIILEEVAEDGTVTEQRLTELGWDPGHIMFLRGDEDPGLDFWVATNHTGISAGEYAIASLDPTADVNEEQIKDRTNTLIGLIRDRACHVLATYNVGKSVEFVKL